jgi:type IV secretion system protein VirB6
MSGSCSGAIADGVVRGVLSAVDCQTRSFAEAGYSALTAPSSNFQIALTALLAIYVALVGYRLLFASSGARLSDAPGIALKIGAILALVTSWATFQTLVFDMASEAPKEIAGIVAGPLQASSSSLVANPVEGLQSAYDQLTQAAVAFGKTAGPTAKAYSSPEAAAAEALSAGTGVLFMTTVGLICAATLSIGVLTAVGPVFIAMFLMPATRGVFSGWVRALTAAALILMLAWLGVVLLLSVLEPWLLELLRQRQSGRIEASTGSTAAALVFVFGAAQLALAAGACVIAFGFRVGRLGAAPQSRQAAPATPEAAEAAVVSASRAQRLAMAIQREPAAASMAARTLQLSGALSPAGPGASPRHLPPPPERRLGDDYRRPTTISRRARGSR